MGESFCPSFAIPIGDAGTYEILVLDPWEFDEGDRIAEHGYVDSVTMKVTCAALTEPKHVRWAGGGSSMQTGLCLGSDMIRHPRRESPLRAAKLANPYTLLSELQPLLPTIVGTAVAYGADQVNCDLTVYTGDAPARYLINHTRHEFVDASACPASVYLTDCGVGHRVIHPLPLLTADCSPQWGRLRGDLSRLGAWMGDLVAASHSRPSPAFHEIHPAFAEVTATQLS